MEDDGDFRDSVTSGTSTGRFKVNYSVCFGQRKAVFYRTNLQIIKQKVVFWMIIFPVKEEKRGKLPLKKRFY